VRLQFKLPAYAMSATITNTDRNLSISTRTVAHVNAVTTTQTSDQTVIHASMNLHVKFTVQLHFHTIDRWECAEYTFRPKQQKQVLMVTKYGVGTLWLTGQFLVYHHTLVSLSQKKKRNN